MADLSVGEQVAVIEQAIARARKATALAIAAVVVAVIVLALDYMIKNAIVGQVREAARLAAADRENHARAEPARPKFRGGDTDPHSPPVGRAGMVADTAVGTGAPDGAGPVPGAVPRRVAGPPVSTDGDGRRTAGGGPGAVEIPGDGTP
jgi:hypothetical protein